MPDVVSELQSYNQGREAERLALKYRRMSASPFAFLRGTCHLFYARMPRAAVLQKAPLVWACGDLHLENLGSYRADNGQVYFDINDFDEALLAPTGWDLVRLLGSIVVARELLGANRKQARQLCELVLEIYARALSDGKARWVERETASAPVRGLLAHADASHHDKLLASRTTLRGGACKIKLRAKKALFANHTDQETIRTLFAELADEHELLARTKVLDVARRVAGTGSLGLDRYVVLVEAKRSAERQHLLDLKIATPPAARKNPNIGTQPRFSDDAVRVVAVQRRMQAISAARLLAVRMDGKPFVLRRLLPSEDRVKLETIRQDRVESLLRTVSECLAWDQLRSSGRDGSAICDALIAYGSDRSWQRSLLQLAAAAAEQVERDYDQFHTAYERGMFSG